LSRYICAEQTSAEPGPQTQAKSFFLKKGFFPNLLQKIILKKCFFLPPTILELVSKVKNLSTPVATCSSVSGIINKT